MIKKSIVFLCLLFFMSCATVHPPGSFERKKAAESPRDKILQTLKANVRGSRPVLEGSVGVLPFKDKGGETGLGLAATEFFTSNLSLVGEFDLIDMSYSYLLEAEMAYFSPDKKQQALRAEQVVTGFVTTSGGALFVHGLYRNQDTENYNELAMMEGAENDFFRLVADLGIRFLEKNGITVSQEMADRFYTIPTKNLQAYILYAKGRQAEAMFDYQEASAAYQAASEADPDFKQAEQGSDRMEQQIATTVEVPVETSTPVETTEDLFTNPSEQPPSMEEQSVPSTSSTGTVTIEVELPRE
jgi:hypothetical protein